MRRLMAILVLSTLVLAACGGDGDVDGVEAGGDPGAGAGAGDGDAAPPAAGMCLEGTTDCVDTYVGPPGDEPVSDDGDQPASREPGDDQAADGGYELVEPRGNTVNTRAHSFEDHQTTEPDVVRVLFWGGVEPCFVLDRVEVSETPEAVTITLYAGTAAGEEDTACIEIAKSYATDVQLAQPIGDRQVIDGADAG